VKHVGFAAAFNVETTHQEDFVLGLELAVDPLGGAAVHYWEPINAVYKLRDSRDGRARCKLLMVGLKRQNDLEIALRQNMWLGKILERFEEIVLPD
jgi:hypothetical protein